MPMTRPLGETAGETYVYGLVATGAASAQQQRDNLARINDAAASARAASRMLVLPPVDIPIQGGLADFHGAADGNLVRGAWGKTILRQMDSDIPIAKWGGNKSVLSGVSFWFNSAQGTSGGSVAAGGNAGANCLELWDVSRSVLENVECYRGARGLFMPQADCSGLGDNTFFDNIVSNIHLLGQSYGAMDMRTCGGGSTTNFFAGIRIRGGSIGNRTTMCRPLIMSGFDDSVFASINFEHMKPNAIASADSQSRDGMIVLSDSKINIKSMHCEGIEPNRDNTAILMLNSNTVCQIDHLTLAISYILNTNGMNFFSLARLGATESHARFGLVLDKGNTVTSATFVPGYASAATGGSIEIEKVVSQSTASGKFSYFGSVLPTSAGKVLKKLEGRSPTSWMKAGRYYGQRNANTTSIPIGSRLFAMPFVVEHPVKIASIGVNVTALTANNQIQVGLYYSDGSNTPGALVARSGPTTLVANTNAVALTAEAALMPGVYWLAVICYNTGGGAISTYTMLAASVSNQVAALVGATDMAGINASGSSPTCVYADQTIADASAWAAYTLPAAFPAATVGLGTMMPHLAFIPSAVP